MVVPLFSLLIDGQENLSSIQFADSSGSLITVLISVQFNTAIP